MGKASFSQNHMRLLQLMKDRGFGWEDRTGKGHNKIFFRCPNGSAFQWVVSCTPSDCRSWRNETSTLRRMLREAGYPDERLHLRIAVTDPDLNDLRLVYDFIDQVAAELDGEV